MFNPIVQLKSGGYIVIGITEALVAIDVNSGRATNGCVHSFYCSMTTAWNVRYLIQKGVEKNVKILTIIIPCNLIN